MSQKIIIIIIILFNFLAKVFKESWFLAKIMLFFKELKSLVVELIKLKSSHDVEMFVKWHV